MNLKFQIKENIYIKFQDMTNQDFFKILKKDTMIFINFMN